MTSTPGDRRSRRAARRAEARGAEVRRSSTSRWLLPGLVVVAIAVAGILAIVLSGSGRPAGGGSSTPPPSAVAGGSGSPVASSEPIITGAPLPAFENPNGDAAVGMPAPQVEGAGFDGAPASVRADGRPKVVVFVAHWCPHCQAEVPLIQAWVTAGGVPGGVDVVSVVTGSDPARPNYPPDAWLAREGWTLPVIVDPTNSVASAFGLPAYPYWVFIGPDGNVRARATGELPMADLEAAIRGLTGG